MYRRKLFVSGKLYDYEKSHDVFFWAVKESVAYHRQHCPAYDKILSHKGFSLDDIKSIDDLYKLPPIPTAYLKTHPLLSKQKEKMLIKSESSGTSGKPSFVGLDKSTCFFGLFMLQKILKYHKLFSCIPTNYLILGYKPSKRNKMGAVKTAFGSTFLAPALRREYAIIDTGTEYELNEEGVLLAIHRYFKSGFPVRLCGFPAYMYYLLARLKESGIKYHLNKKSMIILGGGWKQFFSEKVEKRQLFQLAHETLGIEEKRFKEIFGVVEHNVLYVDCKNHHFHVPRYARVIIRDPKSLEPLPYGSPGILNLITPLVSSMPLTSIMTDDVAVLHKAEECGCGIDAPYFEILGRAGMDEIKTCAANADETLAKQS